MSFDVITVRCARPGCVHVKGMVNHWWIVAIMPGPTGHPEAKWFLSEQFSDKAWLRMKEQIGEGKQIVAGPVCGAACAQLMYDKFLANKSF